MSAKRFVNLLRDKKERITPVRRALIEILEKAGAPVSVVKIMAELRAVSLNPNKTTIYRELKFLKDNAMVREIQFADKKKRYELEHGDDHHHLVCINCDKIEGIDLGGHLEMEENMIKDTRNFKLVRHSLEFFGYCANCH
jgi:Fur family transcriptional regulator, ferric uptake regulator